MALEIDGINISDGVTTVSITPAAIVMPGGVPNSSDEGAATLKNKSLEDLTTAITDSVDATKAIKFDAAGTTGTATTIVSSQTTDKTLTLPDATDTLVGKATTDILTNKSISGATNTLSAIPQSAVTNLPGDLAAKAPIASPVFTGSVTMPTPFTLGATPVTATGAELNHSVGVTSPIQTQLNAKLPLSGGTLTGPLILNADPVASLGAVTKQYVDNIAQGISWKQVVKVATTVAGTLATSFANGQTVDGVTLVTGDRILIKNQAAPAENGIYTVNASGAPTRATDADTFAELVNASCFVSQGTANVDTAFVCTSNAGGTLGTTAVNFVLFSTAGGYVADGSSLTLTGNTFSVANNGVSNAKIRQSAPLSVIGNPTNATANVTDIAGTANQVLRVNGAGTAVGFGAIDLSQPAAATGVLQATSNPAGTGDVTNPAGSVVNTIAPNAVTNAKMAAMAATTFKANSTAGSATPTDVTPTVARTMLSIKAGNALGTAFAGNPKKLTITFPTPFPDANYAISIIGAVNRTWTYEAKTAAGFTINANSNTAFTTEVSWMAIPNGNP